MIEFGSALKAAREAKGLTIPQLADQTHMLTSVIDGLEREDFTKIAAPIYGRGFVKLYCEAVGLEQKPYVDEFMEIFNGNRDVTIRERPVPPPTVKSVTENAPETAPTDPVAKTASPRSPQMGLFDPPEPEPVKMPLSEAVSQPYAEQPGKPGENVPDEESPAFSRYAMPLHSRYERPVIAWPMVLRWGLIALACAAMLAVVIFGLGALYRATSTPKVPRKTPAESPVPTPVQTKAAQTRERRQPPSETKRIPVRIPDLYID